MSNLTARLSLKRTSALFQAGILALVTLVPLLTLVSPASANQLDDRFIDMSANGTSEGSGRDGGDAAGQDVTYTVGFEVKTNHTNIRGIVIEFCDSPLIGTACNTPTGFNTNFATLAIDTTTFASGITGAWVKDTGTDANSLYLTQAGGQSLVTDDDVKFNLGTATAADGITNPTSAGSFYARIVTYTSTANALGYTSLNPDAVGANVDEGAVAMAVSNELTVTARVQEVLQFCVGTAEAGTDCAGVSGTDVDLGVVDSTTVNTTTLAPAYAMIRTNAFYGASIFYKAEQDSTFGGKLKIGGSTCTDNVSMLDRCFNSAIGSGTTAAPVSNTIAAGTEEFGMTLTSVDTTNGGATTNLSRNTAYDGDGGTAGTCTAADAGVDEDCWAWADTGVFDTIASSASVLDDEMVTIAFAATAAPTTPTGLYTVTANFVATATF